MFDRSPQQEVNFAERSHRPHINQGPQLTSRVEAFVKITGEQGAIRFDQAQHWLGLLSPAAEKMKESDLLSAERTRKVMRPLIDQGFVQYKVFYVGQKGWFWLTSKGLRYFDIPLRSYEPTPASLNHLYAVNAIRYLTALRRPADTWRSERVLRSEQHTNQEGSKLAHLPDAEVISPNETIKAIECELTVKNEKYLEKVVFDLAGNARYNAIWYFLPSHVKPAVISTIRKLPQEHQKRFAVYNLKGDPV